MPHPIHWRSILASSHLRLCLPSGLFHSGLPTKTLYEPLLSLIHTTCPTHLLLLDLITQITFADKYRSQSSLLCSVLHSCYIITHRPHHLPQHPVPSIPLRIFMHVNKTLASAHRQSVPSFSCLYLDISLSCVQEVQQHPHVCSTHTRELNDNWALGGRSLVEDQLDERTRRC